jgi:hypothetical protein
MRTPGQRGHWIDISTADEVAVVGDLHGHVENFRRILGAVDLQGHPSRQLVLQEVVHGPFRYPGGGDKSHQLLDVVAALKCQYPTRVHFLLGNHELAQWTGQWIAKDELDLNDQFSAGVEAAYGSHAGAVYAAYLALFSVVPVVIRTTNRVLLTHSLPSASRSAEINAEMFQRETWEESDLQRGGCVYSLVWGRDTSESNVAAFLEMMDADWLVTGHIPCDNGFDVPNTRQIILDAKGTPAAYCVFSAKDAMDQQKLIQGISLLT